MTKEKTPERGIELCRSTLKMDKDGTYILTFKDAELDDVRASFNFDNSIQLDTKNFTYITLTSDNLIELCNYIRVTQDLYHKKYKEDNYGPLEMD